MTSIESTRLLLRDYRDDLSELESILKFVSDPEVARHSSWGPLSRAEALAFLKEVVSAVHAQPRMNYSLALLIRSTDELIGNMSLNIRNLKHREAELGYTVAMAHWNKGYASEAARALIAFGFKQLGLHRIIATTSPGNIASQKVLERIGFTREGYLKQNVLQRGSWRDSLLY
ncbi:MAG TPA: GNAT family N-acetyltransferase, partial [Oligoflexus sp.]|uniref:GNAT family N-acetyltransferase n=1 Tax=Oligoflexus sp. TaxID=1971216 RepID=UPI002D4DD803